MSLETYMVRDIDGTPWRLYIRGELMAQIYQKNIAIIMFDYLIMCYGSRPYTAKESGKTLKLYINGDIDLEKSLNCCCDDKGKVTFADQH